MSQTMAVVPAAPALIPGIARGVPPELDRLLVACDHVLSEVVRSHDEVVLVAAVDVPRDLLPDAGLSLGAGLPSGEAQPREEGPPPGLKDQPVTGWRVGDSLLDRVGFGGVRLRVQPGAAPRPGAALVFLADGSAAAGPKPPRPSEQGDDFDRSLADALRSGDSEFLAALDDTTAARVGCTTAAVWRDLARHVGPERACADLTIAAPFGVTYFAGLWDNRTTRQ